MSDKSGIASLTGWRKGMADAHDAYDYASGGSIASGGPIAAPEYPLSNLPSSTYSEALPYGRGFADGGDVDELSGSDLAQANSLAGNFGIQQWAPPAAGSYTAPALPNQTTYQDQYAADRAAMPSSAGIDAYVNDLNRQFKAGPKYAATAGVPIGIASSTGDTNTGTTGSSGTGAGGSGTSTVTGDTTDTGFTGDTGNTGAGAVTAVAPGFTVTPREREGLTTVEDVDTGENLLNTDTNYDTNPTETYPGADGTDTTLTDAEYQAILDSGADPGPGYNYSSTGTEDLTRGAISDRLRDQGLQDIVVDNKLFGDMPEHSELNTSFLDRMGNLMDSGENAATSAIKSAFEAIPGAKTLEDVAAAYPRLAKFIGQIVGGSGGREAVQRMIDNSIARANQITGATGSTGATGTQVTAPGAGANGFVDLSQGNADNSYVNDMLSGAANTSTSFLDDPTFWGSMQNSDNAANGRLATNFSSSSGIDPNFGMGANSFQFYSNGLNLQGGEPLSIYNPPSSTYQADNQASDDTYTGLSPEELMRQNMLMGANWTIGNPDAESYIQAMGGKYAKGGDIHGGLGSLPEYKAGGILRGPGDGMSDDIPAVIKGPTPQRAALADGEFVIPADVVSHLGNGSTEAGSKRLYAMMDKVRHARTGNKKQGKQINPDKFLPA